MLKKHCYLKDINHMKIKVLNHVLFCSAGVGRSGTVMVLNSTLEMSKAESKIDILGLLYKMRQQRINLIETVVSAVYRQKIFRDI